MNSLNLAQLSGYGVGHIDHPGTPVQMSGALIIKLLNPGKNNSEIVTQVLSNPEYYMGRINLFFILLIGISVLILGLFTYRKTGNIYLSLLLQLTPLYPSTVYDHFTDISSESLFIVAILFFITVTFCFVNESSTSDKRLRNYMIVFGLVCGFGLACKIIFFPLLIIPFILLKKTSNKFIFLFITLLSFLVFIFPALSLENSSKYLNWITGIASHSGKYGTGEQSLFDSNTEGSNIKKIFLDDISFLISYLSMLVIIILQFIPAYKQKIRATKYFKLLVGILLSMSLQIILVSKHFDSRYMIPCYLLSVTALIASGFILKDIFFRGLNKLWLNLPAAIIILFSFYHIVRIFSEYSVYSFKKNETENLNNFIEANYKGTTLIKSGLVNNKVYSLYFGTDWAGSQQKNYISVLEGLYPDFFYYDRYGGDFSLTNKDKLKNILSGSGKVIYEYDDISLTDGFLSKLKQLTQDENISVKKVFENNNGEGIYEIMLAK